MNNILKAAKWYIKSGYSIIPIRKDKKPFIKWTKYQFEKATYKDAQKWWEKWPHANIGIITGEISGIDVIDCDSENGKIALNEFLPDTFETPISKTPKGWHYYFKYSGKIKNGVRIITDCDIRSDGGYVIAPPSINGNKKYIWHSDLKISNIKLASIPVFLLDMLSTNNSINKNIYISNNKKNNNINTRDTGNHFSMSQTSQKVTESHRYVTQRHISFEKGARDETLFYLANHLVKSGMDLINIEKYLTFIADRMNPPYDRKDVKIKIESALQRFESNEKNITQEIRDIISVTSGDFSVTNAYQDVTAVTKKQRASVRTAIKRLVNEGLLEPKGTRAGCYRIVDGNCAPEDWQNAKYEKTEIWLPFELDTMIEIPQGSIILFAGSQDAGKTAIMMNIARYNMNEFDTHYYSSEMSAASFQNRAKKFSDIFIDQWDVKFYSRGSGFSDLIKPDKKRLNIIDYLEMHENFYLASKHLDDIYRKMDGKGITIIAVQKDPNKEFGRGGSFIEEKPVLSIALDRGGLATINKFKGEWRDENPRGRQYRFKIINGCKLVRVHHWQLPIPKELLNKKGIKNEF